MALTAIGVVIGTAAVVVLVSLGIGLQRNATEQLGGISDLTLIQVSPTYGEAGPIGGGGGGGGGGGSGPRMPTVDRACSRPQAWRTWPRCKASWRSIPRDYLQVGADS